MQVDFKEIQSKLSQSWLNVLNIFIPGAKAPTVEFSLEGQKTRRMNDLFIPNEWFIPIE